MKHYYEFRDNEYYALVVVTGDVRVDTKFNPHVEATKLYIGIVGDKTVEEVLDEAHPYSVLEEYAFMKVFRDKTIGDLKIKMVAKEFDNMLNGVLLVDGGLL
jgi:hypothetical protein